MPLTFWIFAVMTILAAAGAVGFRHPIHCVLSVVGAFGGLAGLLLVLDAPFLALAQIFVYVGAVAILLVFAILLTPGDTPMPRFTRGRSGILMGAGVSSLVVLFLVGAVVRSSGLGSKPAEDVIVSVRAIGILLMSDYVVALQLVGLLLTVALVGAVLLAMPEREQPPDEGAHPSRSLPNANETSEGAS